MSVSSLIRQVDRFFICTHVQVRYKTSSDTFLIAETTGDLRLNQTLPPQIAEHRYHFKREWILCVATLLRKQYLSSCIRFGRMHFLPVTGSNRF